MENTEKLRVLLQHWIDHNKGHVQEFEPWQKTMQEEGKQSVADHIAKAIASMGVVNEDLTKALEELGGPQDSHEHGGHHHHHHHHH